MSELLGRQRNRSRFLTGVTVFALALCLGLVAGLGWVVKRQLTELESASSDNLQWTLSQAEVEYLRMTLAIERAADGTGSLSEARRRFDVLYSRMATLESSTAFDALRADPGLAESLQRIREFLEGGVPLVDGSDAGLRNAMPELVPAAAALEPDIRALGLEGLAIFTELSDSRRDQLVRTLLLMAGVLGVLLCGLVLVAGILLGLARNSSRRSREALETAERLRTIVETSLDAIIVTDAAGIIREFNPAAEKVFGLARSEARGRVAAELILPEESARELSGGLLAFWDEDRRPSPEERHFELAARHSSGRVFPAEFTIDRAEQDEGPVFVAVIRDISGRKAAEAGLTQARDRALAGERAKAEFLAVMSHEMRTPLNGLLGTMELLRDHSLTETQSDLLDRMQSSGRLLLGLVNDVLDLAKFEAGKMRSEVRPFSVDRLVEGVVETAAPLAAANGNTLSWSWTGPSVDAVLGDPRRLRQVLLNLVGNAVKFTRGGSVELEVEAVGPQGAELEFRVIDTGIGIAEEHMDRIFEDFETLDSSYAREAGGTGLGLGIARRLVRLMGGEIGAESEPGEGSLFWLRVPVRPIDEAPETAAPARPARPAPRKPLDLLLVEDNEINRFVARAMLEAEGHKVTEAVNGRIGVDCAAAHRFDAILMDISMPEMDGPEAARLIRAGSGASARVPIIAVTAHALPEEIATFREAGMDACISKPLEREVLMETLARIGSGGLAPAAVMPGPARMIARSNRTQSQAAWKTMAVGKRWQLRPDTVFIRDGRVQIIRLAIGAGQPDNSAGGAS
ncbi:hybrid sensor histidine kinase/response regulator [Mangrovicoccus ximenensis]|uniref:hybrid sensor histidine kinase/response regulator n=1 Tax=Mangrovicoccus ximenensis TaxID=1911570 RepID=UPI0011AE54FF|nr:PAS domain-containing hybrid sensor histidine kinase/response regulator [Mangrovicoccus ximenensis]